MPRLSKEDLERELRAIAARMVIGKATDQDIRRYARLRPGNEALADRVAGEEREKAIARLNPFN